ncbi:type II secretion system protein GspM [Ferrovibrio sp.]|uniref:type II secretion system protein GspM n=1 Tax=Ferrovibrio sp. TaxID=1917215 RepID=UPI0035B3FC95
MNRLAMPLLVLLGLGILLAAGGFGLGQYRLLRAELDSLQSEADLLRRAAQRPALADQDTDSLIRASSETAALAGLLEFTKSVIEGAGGAVVALQPRPGAPRPDGAIGLRAQFSADTAGLQAALHALESARPTLLVEGLLLRTARGSAENEPTRLDATLDLIGFRGLE